MNTTEQVISTLSDPKFWEMILILSPISLFVITPGGVAWVWFCITVWERVL
ncbi:MAG: hypothetical protein WCV88_04645 [Patescibacteria group bacterium]|jgi:hypothetical protein